MVFKSQFSDCNEPFDKPLELVVDTYAFPERYTWDNKKKKCIRIFYGGTELSNNLFEDLSECQEVASRICK